MKRVISKITVIYFLIITVPLFSQEVHHTYDRAGFIKDSLYIVRTKIVRPQVRIDNRYAFYKGQVIALNGYDAGVMLKDKIRLTLGYYQLAETLKNYPFKVGGVYYEQELSMRYWSVNFEFVYKQNRWISLGMPVEFGIGTNRLKTITEDLQQEISNERGFMMLMDFGLSGTFKPIRWIGIRGVVGYRRNFVNMIHGHKFNGFFASVGLNFDLQEISRDIQLMRLKKRYKRFGNPLNETIDRIME